MRRILVVATSLILTASVLCAFADGMTPPMVTVPRVASAGAIWRNAPCIAWLPSLDGRGLPTQRTEIRLGYDEANLYVAFRCFENRMDKLVASCARHDEPVFNDDSIDIILDPRHDHKSWFQTIANAVGARYDTKDGKGTKAWDGEWMVDSRKGKGFWTAFVTIPFRSLGVAAPKPGAQWGASFLRREQFRNELTCWSPVATGHVLPPRYGHLVFGAADAPIITLLPINIAAPGAHSAQVQVDNRSRTPVRLVARAKVDGGPPKAVRGILKIGRSDWQIPFQVAAEGKSRLSLSVSDAEGRMLMRTPRVTFEIPRHRAEMARLRAAANRIVPRTTAGKRRKAYIGKLLDDQVVTAKLAEGSAGKWAELGRALESVDRQIAALRYACADSRATGYALGRETSLVKPRRDLPFRGRLSGPVEISLCRNEYEAAQVVILAYGKALESVQVSVSPLAGPGGVVISTDRIELNRVGWVHTQKPVYPIDYVGWYPDPLMGIEPFSVAKYGNQPIWVTIHTPETTPPGDYTGTITVRPANAPEQSLPLHVHVWDFALPKETHLKTAFTMCEGQIGAWYGGITDDLRRSYYQFVLDHRMNPINIYSAALMPTKELMPFCAERGLNSFNLTYVNDDLDAPGRAALLKDLKEREAFLKANGWWDKAYIYGFDEVQQAKVPALKSMFGWIKQNFPDLPRMCTTQPSEQLKGYVDIWCPILHGYDQKTAEEFTKAGDQVWWYVAWIPSHPYPNILTDYPAIDHRVLFWMNWKYHVPGFLYYFINAWGSNYVPPAQPGSKPAKRWPDVPWNTVTFGQCNGDGQLIYPGPDGKPISSVRFECIRDGIEDYEYFYLLNDHVMRAETSPGKADPALLAKASRLLAVDDAVVKSTCDFTQDPEAMLKARAELAELIESLR